MAGQRGLGRGLGALFGEDNVGRPDGGATLLPISKIERNEAQPRTEFDEDALRELSESIKKHGLITPIAVRRLSDGAYQIIAGERRWRACRLAGLSEIPAVVIDADDRRVLELALIENLQREDLNPIEEAEGYRSLMSDYGLTQEGVAERVGRSRPAVANALRLLSLPEEVRGMVSRGELSGGHARAILSLGDGDKMSLAAKRVVAQGLSVRQTEDFVRKTSAQPAAADKPAKPAAVEVDYGAELARELSAALGRRVAVSHGGKNGKIELEYYGLDDLDKLVKQLKAGAFLERK